MNQMILNSEIKYLVIDVDGTMTDSGIYYDNYGNELKRFSTRDGEAIKMARQASVKILVLTGRSCPATERRVKELHIDYLEQGVLDKKPALQKFMHTHRISREEIGYIGDDINDLEAMELCGFIGCPADSCKEVKKSADYISTVNGGYGAVRDIIEYLLKRT